MATKFWRGIAAALSQITTVAITAYDAATTYSLRINGITIASAIGSGSANAVAAALVTAWNASTNPYRIGITASGATSPLTLTSVAGLPFTVTSAVAGGTGTIGSPTTTQAATGPNFWDNVLNWSDGAVPANSDTVIFRDNAVNVCWALDQNAVDLTLLVIEQSYTGKIGLPFATVAQSANGDTQGAAQEYRDRYLRIGWATARIGEHSGAGQPAGAGRLKLHNDSASASSTHIVNTAAVGADLGLPAVRLKNNANTGNVFIRSAPGGVGLAADEPAETSTYGNVSISDTSEISRVYTGDGLTVTNWDQTGGTNRLRAAATVTLVDVDGGQLTLDGTNAITTLTIGGGTVIANNAPAAGAAIVTANLNAGVLDFAQSPTPRTVTTLNPNLGELRADKGVLTVTTLTQPSGPYRAVIS